MGVTERNGDVETSSALPRTPSMDPILSGTFCWRLRPVRGHEACVKLMARQRGKKQDISSSHNTYGAGQVPITHKGLDRGPGRVSWPKERASPVPITHSAGLVVAFASAPAASCGAHGPAIYREPNSRRHSTVPAAGTSGCEEQARLCHSFPVMVRGSRAAGGIRRCPLQGVRAARSRHGCATHFRSRSGGAEQQEAFVGARCMDFRLRGAGTAVPLIPGQGPGEPSSRRHSSVPGAGSSGCEEQARLCHSFPVNGRGGFHHFLGQFSVPSASTPPVDSLLTSEADMEHFRPFSSLGSEAFPATDSPETILSTSSDDTTRLHPVIGRASFPGKYLVFDFEINVLNTGSPGDLPAVDMEGIRIEWICHFYVFFSLKGP
ncbi:hypothetical protein HC256_003057 [Beauveria bassiana]|nr:hypothetical protein HC256_003057 [Beauveria bassiana]